MTAPDLSTLRERIEAVDRQIIALLAERLRIVEDVASGARTTIEARGDSPLQLALALARALTQLPRLGARSAVRGLLGRRRGKSTDR